MTQRTDLKQRIDDELETLTPMGDISTRVIHQGTRDRRRRTAWIAGGVALSVTALSLGASLMSGLGVDESPPRHTGGPAGVSAQADDPTNPTSEDGAIPQDPELKEALKKAAKAHGRGMSAKREAMQALLPARYGEVSIAGPNEAWSFPHLVTEGGDPRLELDMFVQGNPGVHRNRDWNCTSQTAARPIIRCVEADLGDGWFAVATFEKVGPADDGGGPTYGTALEVMHPDNVFAEFVFNPQGWDGHSLGQPAGISPEELIEMAKQPELMELLREQVKVERQAKPDPQDVGEVVKPVWPN